MLSDNTRMNLRREMNTLRNMKAEVELRMLDTARQMSAQLLERDGVEARIAELQKDLGAIEQAFDGAMTVTDGAAIGGGEYSAERYQK